MTKNKINTRGGQMTCPFCHRCPFQDICTITDEIEVDMRHYENNIPYEEQDE